MTTILNGLLGGLGVGFVAGIVTVLVGSHRSVAGTLLKQVLSEATPTRWQELSTYVLYGGLAGTLLLILELFVVRMLGVPPSVGEAFGIAVVWAGLLFAGWVAVWRFSPLPSSNWLSDLFVYHLVFGLGFGLWIRVTWIT